MEHHCDLVVLRTMGAAVTIRDASVTLGYPFVIGGDLCDLVLDQERSSSIDGQCFASNNE